MRPFNNNFARRSVNRATRSNTANVNTIFAKKQTTIQICSNNRSKKKRNAPIALWITPKIIIIIIGILFSCTLLWIIFVQRRVVLSHLQCQKARR